MIVNRVNAQVELMSAWRFVNIAVTSQYFLTFL